MLVDLATATVIKVLVLFATVRVTIFSLLVVTPTISIELGLPALLGVSGIREDLLGCPK